MKSVTDTEPAPADSARPLLVVENLSKHYPLKQGLFGAPRVVRAVDSVSFSIGRGKTFGLIGESGSGKSTLGRATLRLVEPTSGRVVFDGQDIGGLSQSALRPLRKRMQIVLQDPYSSLDPKMTVRKIVGEGISALSLAKRSKQADEKVALALAQVGLPEGVMHLWPHELSGGQRQRIAIARALAVEPDLVVCDEPTSALDPSVQASILNLLERLQEELGVSFLLISHDLRVVSYMSHELAVMYLGKIVETGPAREVVERSAHPYTRALLGSMPGLTAGAGSEPRKRSLLSGEPASPIDPPRGCAFHPRCDKAEQGRCDVRAPVLSPVREGPPHQVACFHPVTD